MKTERIFTNIRGLVLAASLMTSSIGAQFDWASIVGYLKSKAFFITYACSKLTDSSIAANEMPFDLPTPLPEPEQIADMITQYRDPHTFLRGVSTSEHQCSKKCTPELCSWSRFAQEHNLPQPTDEQYAINWWDHYRSYIDYAKNTLHLNAIRFSLEWPLIQPKGPTSFDESTLAHYSDLFIYTIEQGITPLICFHHYTDPCWFLDAGGFYDAKSIDYFSQYCAHAYTAIMTAVAKNRTARNALKKMYPREPLWATFNAPEGYAFRGYHQFMGPPANPELKGLATVAQVLQHELDAHAATYHALKAAHAKLGLEERGIRPPMVGLLKNIHQLDADKSSWLSYALSPLTTCACSFADMIQNGSIYSFFTTGAYRVHVPCLVNLDHINPNAVGTLDFIGLNHYANRSMFLTQTVAPTDPALTSDNPIYYRYPQGMYRAIAEISEKLAHPLHIPLYVAENGIATQDDEKRRLFYHQYTYAIAKAIEDGYPVHGYFPWTLASNYEWPAFENNTSRDYGMCTVDPQHPARLILKNGSRSYTDLTARLAYHERESAHRNRREMPS